MRQILHHVVEVAFFCFGQTSNLSQNVVFLNECGTVKLFQRPHENSFVL